MKQAILIIAHSDLNQLIYLIKSIDYELFDIYLHIDNKSKIIKYDFNSILTKSKLYMLPRRYSVKWGGYSQIKVTLELFKYALNNDNYKYFHLLSGQDMLIKQSKFVFDYFNNSNFEYLSFCGKDWPTLTQNRVKYFHISCGRNKLLKKIDSALTIIQKILRINKIKKMI